MGRGRFLPRSMRPEYVLEPIEADTQPIRIKEGPFADVVYRYKKVKFDEEQDPCVLRFSYELVSWPTIYTREDLEGRDDFKESIGKILEHLIELRSNIGDALVESRREDTERPADE